MLEVFSKLEIISNFTNKIARWLKARYWNAGYPHAGHTKSPF